MLKLIQGEGSEACSIKQRVPTLGSSTILATSADTQSFKPNAITFFMVSVRVKGRVAATSQDN